MAISEVNSWKSTSWRKATFGNSLENDGPMEDNTC
jgi:hypothetical protein